MSSVQVVWLLNSRCLRKIDHHAGAYGNIEFLHFVMFVHGYKKKNTKHREYRTLPRLAQPSDSDYTQSTFK